jgi:Carboxypeptidase regulatory-like domain
MSLTGLSFAARPFWRRLGTHRVIETVQLRTIQFGREFGLAALLFTLASGVCVAAPTAAISGVVRDTQGVAQMGAMVQVLAAGSGSVGTAFTDLYGRYKIANLVPGKYEVRATAALFVPATRANLRLLTGARATVNLTLTMLYDPAAWLPAEHRKADERDDDWTWTMRSAANRPILRLLDDGQVVLVPGEGSRRESLEARASLLGGDGGFGDGGLHSVFALDRGMPSGTDVVLRTDIAAAQTPYGPAPSVEVDAGYERRMGFAGASRLVVSYASHPEMRNADGSMGLQMTRMASAQQMKLGDAVDVEAGSTVYAVHTTGDAIATQPFVRVTVHPGQVWAVRYSLATSRDVQGFDGLDSVAAGVPLTAAVNGLLRTESGRHQEFAVSRRFGDEGHGATIQAAVYHDAIERSVIGGTGVLGAGDMLPGSGSSGVVADTATGSFGFLGTGYTTRGVSVMVSEPVTSNMLAVLEYENGAALATRSTMAMSLPEVTAGLHAEQAEAVTAAVKGQMLRSGTKVRAAYRWQPRRLVTAVGSYEAFSDQAFLSCSVRQALRWGNRLPPGLEATVDVTNLLAQGYQPFLSADGRTLFLAQSPRTLQAGLSFTF